MGFLHTFEPSSAAFALGGLTVQWYGLALALATGIGLVVTLGLARRWNFPTGRVFDLVLAVTIVGFVGARLYHVLNEPAYYWSHPGEIVQVWHGGLAIHGGLLFGGVAFLFLARRAKLPIGRLADVIAPGLLLAQAIGRWGNYFNQELFGRATNLPWGIPIAPEFRPADALDSTYFHPVFLYEFILDLLGAVVLFLWHRRELKKPTDQRGPAGCFFFAYLVMAGVGRIVAEVFRFDPTPSLGGLRLPLLVSLLLIAAGSIGLRKIRIQGRGQGIHSLRPKSIGSRPRAE